MALPTALLVKGGVGVAAVAAPVSIYFITDGMNKKKLREENKELNEKITALGIADTTCHFEDIKDKAECELDETKVKAINFTNKTNSDQTLSGLDGDKKIDLVIEKGYKDSDFPEGLRFTFTNSNSGEVKIGDTSNEIKLLQNTSYDFKIKTETNNEIKLEKAWTQKSLAEKVGITCSTDTETQCDISEAGLNFWTSDTDYLTQGKNSESSKKITVAKETSNYFEGLKFTVSQDITLTTAGTPNKTKQLSNSSKSYEINVKDIGGTKTWFLVEKPTPASSVPQESQ